MSNYEPTEFYAYQPDPAAANGGFIYAVSGPFVDPMSMLFGRARFKSREDAENVAAAINGLIKSASGPSSDHKDDGGVW